MQMIKPNQHADLVLLLKIKVIRNNLLVSILYQFIILTLFIAVLIWDDSQKEQDTKFVLEFTFAQPVVAVRMRMDR